MLQHADKTNDQSRAIANNLSRNGGGRSISLSPPAQRVLMRNPQGSRKRLDMERGIQAGDAMVAGDFLWESTTNRWYRYKSNKSATEIFITAEAGNPVYLYNMVNGTYRDVDQEAHAGIVAKMNEINAGGDANSGVHYPFNYEQNHHDRWQADFANGYANQVYFQRNNPSDWTLRAGQRASVALQAWLTGLTIAECASTLVAIQLDAVRRTVGDAAFDTKFGPAGAGAAPTVQRLRICGDISLCLPENYLAGAGTNDDGTAALVVGAKYFFGNHSKYPLKHPAGFFQGENCVYIGNDSWSGFGVDSYTTAQMYLLMRDQYNRARTEADYESILTTGEGNHNIPAETLAAERQQGRTYAQVYAAHPDNINPYVRTGTEFLPETITLAQLAADENAGITSQGIKLDVRALLGIA
ncbi:MAG TPA: hypothetical protein VFE32_11105 [Puia sp.]|jgi:hypothetical protein|nr:hypothetical protein [Puia sp.]